MTRFEEQRMTVWFLVDLLKKDKMSKDDKEIIKQIVLERP